MTIEQFEDFLEQRKDFLEWAEDEDNFLFRDLRFDFYSKHSDRAARVVKTRMRDLTPQQLEDAITHGLKVQHIARVTGYFSIVNNFNPGKKAELRDRHRIF